VPGNVAVLAGDDLYAGSLLALGAHGAILACANVATRDYADLVDAWRVGPLEHGRRLNNRLVPLARAIFAEPNPAVIKGVLAAHGRIPSPHVRLPLLPSSAAATAAALACCQTLQLSTTDPALSPALPRR
jgi:4-hydroxy-tetrahydrodipicolinate synthase